MQGKKNHTESLKYVNNETSLCPLVDLKGNQQLSINEKKEKITGKEVKLSIS